MLNQIIWISSLFIIFGCTTPEIHLTNKTSNLQDSRNGSRHKYHFTVHVGADEGVLTNTINLQLEIRGKQYAMTNPSNTGTGDWVKTVAVPEAICDGKIHVKVSGKYEYQYPRRHSHKDMEFDVELVDVENLVVANTWAGPSTPAWKPIISADHLGVQSLQENPLVGTFTIVNWANGPITISDIENITDNNKINIDKYNLPHTLANCGDYLLVRIIANQSILPEERETIVIKTNRAALPLIKKSISIQFYGGS